MEPINVNDPTLWDMLFKIFGAGGIPLLLIAAGEGWAIKILLEKIDKKDADIKAKDEECQKELATAQAGWTERFNQMRADIKEAFGIVGTLSEKVTILAERAANMRTRES